MVSLTSDIETTRFKEEWEMERRGKGQFSGFYMGQILVKTPPLCYILQSFAFVCVLFKESVLFLTELHLVFGGGKVTGL